MRYYLLDYYKEKYWLEINTDMYAYRQIFLDEMGIMHVSCLEDCLPEGLIDLEELAGEIIEIKESEFENVWMSVISEHFESWKKIKEKYPLGEYIQGICKYFYPQGAIIKCDDCLALYKGIKELKINHCIQMKVYQYDDINMWLVTKQ